MSEIFEIEPVLECNVCGKGLSLAVSGKDRYGNPILKVDPCSNCLSDEYRRGLEDSEAK